MTFRTYAVVGLAAVSLAHVVGCNGCGTSTALPPDPAASATSAADAMASAAPSAPSPSGSNDPPVRHRKVGGPATVFVKAARAAAGVKPEQKPQIAEAEAKIAGSPAESRDAFKAIRADVVTGLRAGALDDAKLEGRWAIVDQGTRARQASDVAALNALWAALEPAQRVAVAQKLRGEHPTMQEWTKQWMTDGRGRVQETQKTLEQLTDDLSLDPDQKKKVTILAYKPSTVTGSLEMQFEAKKHLLGLIEVFDKPDFDAAKVPAPAPKIMRGPLSVEAYYAGQLIPILTAEQRTKLAAHFDRSGGAGGD